MIDKNEALKRLASLENETKELEKIINKCDEPKNIMERVKSFKDACEILGLCEEKLPDVSMLPQEHQKSIIANYKLIIIISALNEGWKPNWANTDQKKWYSWFEYNRGGCASGFGFSYTACDDWSTSATVGSRLCFKTEELAKYVGKQFLDIYNDYIILK